MFFFRVNRVAAILLACIIASQARAAIISADALFEEGPVEDWVNNQLSLQPQHESDDERRREERPERILRQELQATSTFSMSNSPCGGGSCSPAALEHVLEVAKPRAIGLVLERNVNISNPDLLGISHVPRL